MPRIYLDTNIYIIGFRYLDTNSSIILNEIKRFDIEVTQSDYLYDELFEYFRSKGRRDDIGLIRKYLITIPNNRFIGKKIWSPYVDSYRDLISDVDDIPHICCYFADNCSHFITTNRRLTRMKIGGIVNFMSPREFVEYIHLDPVETKQGV